MKDFTNATAFSQRESAYLPVTLDGQIETAEAVPSKRVGTTLDDNCLRLVVLHDSLHDWVENGFEGFIIDAIL